MLDRILSSAAAAAAVLLVAGCAAPVTQRTTVDSAARAQEQRTQQLLAVKTQFDHQKRLWNVGYAVLKGAASECKDMVRQSVGLFIVSRERFPEKSRELVSAALGADDKLRVAAVYRGSAAEAAGIRVGDVLLSAYPVLPHGTTQDSRADSLNRLPKGAAIPVRLLRNGQESTVSVTPDTVCDYPLNATLAPEVNAYADGKAIFVTRGMMRFAADDKELALVVGHELGHNTMGHIGKKKANVLIGAIFDGLAAAKGVNTQSAFANAGASAYSQEFEHEADYVGMYYLARAGYDTQGAADFWRRMAAENPSNIKGSYSSTHPSTTDRFLTLDKVSGEVRSKQSSGAALVPNLK